MKKLLLIFLALMVNFSGAFSQQEKEIKIGSNSKRNAVYGSLGIPVGYLLLNYERQIFWISEAKMAIDMRLSYGSYANLGETGKASIICSEFVFGKNKNHFETDIGLAINRVHNSQAKPMAPYLPCIGICYRIQKNNKPFLFKIGIGFPEGAFFCIGALF